MTSEAGVLVGGGLGGVAAALAACRAGRSVLLTEDVVPHQVQAQDAAYERFAAVLDRGGVQLHWPDVRGY